jgi:hypothetical protein
MALGLLPGVFEVPQAIEPSNARPTHKENGMVFISDFLRSIWIRHLRVGLATPRAGALGRAMSFDGTRPYDLDRSDSMPSGLYRIEYRNARFGIARVTEISCVSGFQARGSLGKSD